jgi:hypothetical protein
MNDPMDATDGQAQTRLGRISFGILMLGGIAVALPIAIEAATSVLLIWLGYLGRFLIVAGGALILGRYDTRKRLERQGALSIAALAIISLISVLRGLL